MSRAELTPHEVVAYAEERVALAEQVFDEIQARLRRARPVNDALSSCAVAAVLDEMEPWPGGLTSCDLLAVTMRRLRKLADEGPKLPISNRETPQRGDYER
ncbi:hypothetical protein AAHS21_31425 [Mycobacterium sp. 050272]|uniref:hypothetical protein n=1 Tax=Mycobacterium sp. 050272 TaxID=3142488 RepID=UPI00319373CB